MKHRIVTAAQMKAIEQAGNAHGLPYLQMIEQTKEVLSLIDKLLAEIGSEKGKILTTQIFLADMADYAQLNQAWDEWVDSQNPPSRATVEAKLADPDWKVEIVIIAVV